MNRKTRKRTTVLKDYVTVAFAEDMDLAREYSNLLAQNDIPSVLKIWEIPAGRPKRCRVMVPEDR